MEYKIKRIQLENFKSFSDIQAINTSDLSVFLGANSSGKSTAIQALLVLKQTMECNSPDVELLLSGKYVALGDFDDIIYDKSRNEFVIGLDFEYTNKKETSEETDQYSIKWFFDKAKDNESARLNRIKIVYEDVNITLVKKSFAKYQMELGKEQKPIMMGVRNLRFSGDYYINYDKEFNKLFASFINSLKEILDGKKFNRIPANELVSPKINQIFYSWMIYHVQVGAPKKQIDNKIKQLVKDVVELIDEYVDFQYPFGKDEGYFTQEMKIDLLSNVFNNTEKEKALSKIYEKYKKELDDFKNTSRRSIDDYDGEESINSYWFKLSDEGNRNTLVNSIRWVDEFYDSFEKIIANLFFVGPIRENPQGLYNIGFEQNPKYVGPTGSNFASVLLHENKKRKYILPYEGEKETVLSDALDEWVSHLDIASSVKVSHPTSYGVMVTVSDTQNKNADIMNVGIGTSQVLPVLITGLLSEINETLVFEQPELHLHPYSQSRLVDFFIALIKHGRKVIIETHSEAIILRLRYHVLKGDCDRNDIAISFFQNDNGTKVSLCDISSYGEINYPENFKDETQELLNDLLAVAIKNGGK